MLRILILSDSLALPREQPETCSFDNTWPRLIQSDEVLIHQVSIGGATTGDLLRQCHYHIAFDPDIVIAQAGIVDAAPRFLKSYELGLLRKIPVLGKVIIKKMNTPNVRKIRKITYVNPKKFEDNIKAITTFFKKSQVYFIEIIPALKEYEKIMPGISRNIESYNNILRRVNSNTISVNDVDESGVMSDYHHLNSIGHHQIAKKISALIYKYLLETNVKQDF